MRLIIGLGNPGERYKNNRHNVGYMLVDQVLSSEFVAKKDLKVQKTDCFMNESGKCVRQIAMNYKLITNDLYIVHDDLDIRLGEHKIQEGVGPKLHYGIQSIEQALGTKDFWRIRIGVDNRDPQDRVAGEEYVLQNFTKEELVILHNVFDAILKNRPFQN